MRTHPLTLIPALALGFLLCAAVAPAQVSAAPPAADEALSAEVVDRLSQEQIVEILKKREETKVKTAAMRMGGGVDQKLPIIASVCFFACLFAGVALPLYYRHRKERDQQVTMRLMIEKGATIPVEFLAPPIRPHSDLRRGVLLVGAGLGVAVFLRAVNAAPGAWAFGLVPFLIGAGYLVVWRLSSRGVDDLPRA